MDAHPRDTSPFASCPQRKEPSSAGKLLASDENSEGAAQYATAGSIPWYYSSSALASLGLLLLILFGCTARVSHALRVAGVPSRPATLRAAVRKTPQLKQPLDSRASDPSDGAGATVVNVAPNGLRRNHARSRPRHQRSRRNGRHSSSRLASTPAERGGRCLLGTSPTATSREADPRDRINGDDGSAGCG